MLDLGLYLCRYIVVSTRGCAGTNLCVRHWNCTVIFALIHEEKENGIVIRISW